MSPPQRTLIEALHHAPGQCVLALTGGGTGAAAMLLEVPGASRTVLEVIVPYHEAALSDLLGFRPEQFCSALTSQQMARCAFERAAWLAPGSRVVGVGCTATLATDRPKRGDHRFHVAVHHEEAITYSLTLRKGARDRAGEEALVDTVILNALAEAFHIEERLAPPLLPGEMLQVESQTGTDPLGAFLRGELPAVYVDVDGRLRTGGAPDLALIPGAFNPLHEAHWALAKAAQERLRVCSKTGTGLLNFKSPVPVLEQTLNGLVAFELSVTNVDKPPLPAEEVRRRLDQFRWQAPVWLTRAPTFAEKARLFPGVVFVVGADTAERIVASRYYGNSEAGMATALHEIRQSGCRFLVAGRRYRSGEFLGLEDLAIPEPFRDLFLAIPKEAFRMDVSSTQIRNQESGVRNQNKGLFLTPKL